MTDPEPPVDSARTTRPRAGMIWRDRRQLPGLMLTVLGVLALVAFVSALAIHDSGWTIGAGIAALILLVGGISWILVGRNRTNRAAARSAQQAR